jgi:protein-S-isoprenylcysteine O-methyltransferase Ste14
LSLEHTKLQKKIGEKRGKKIGDILGMISGWGFFIFLIGIWISPQPKFQLNIFEADVFTFPSLNFSVSILNFVIFLVFIIPSVWISLVGVKNVTLKVAETHRAEKIVSHGMYSVVRHPQYLGALFAHVGITFFLSAEYSLLITPGIIIYLIIISKKEEQELLREFGDDYREYMKKIPMFVPKISKNRL